MKTQLWPAPRYNLFCWSFTLSLIFIAFGAPHDSALLRGTAWASRIEWLGVALQLASAIFAVYVLRSYLINRRRPTPLAPRRSLAGAISVVSVLMAIELVLEFFVVKPIFGWNPGSAVNVPAPWLTKNLSMSSLLGTPSGFVMRQAILTVLTVASVNQRHCHPRVNILTKPSTAGTLMAGLTLAVSATRLVAGVHTLFDVSLGFAFGVYIYWWVSIMARLVMERNEIDLRYAERMMVPTIFFVVTPILFARGSASYWLPFAFALFGPLVATYHIISLEDE